jgi:hypothetical protein
MLLPLEFVYINVFVFHFFCLLKCIKMQFPFMEV